MTIDELFSKIKDLPDPDLLTDTDLQGELGSNRYYRAGTVVRLLDAQRGQVAKGANARHPPRAAGVRIVSSDDGFVVDCRPAGALKFKPDFLTGSAANAIKRAAHLLGVRVVCGEEADQLIRERDQAASDLAEVRKVLQEAWPAITEATLARIEAICDASAAWAPDSPSGLSG